MTKILKMLLMNLMLFSFECSLYSMHMNYGLIASYDYSLDTNRCVNNGTINAVNSVKIKAGTLSGNGVIEAPYVTIICDEFQFNGVISCEKECVVYAKKAFDVNNFTRKGKAVFKVVIYPHDVKCLKFEHLGSTVSDDFYSNCLRLTEADINDKIKEIRTQASINFIDEKKALEEVKTKLALKLNFHKEREAQVVDVDALYSGLSKCGLSAIGLSAAYAIFKNDAYLTKKFSADAGSVKVVSIITAGLSALVAGCSYDDFYTWRKPQHREKYEAL